MNVKNIGIFLVSATALAACGGSGSNNSLSSTSIKVDGAYSLFEVSCSAGDLNPEAVPVFQAQIDQNLTMTIAGSKISFSSKDSSNCTKTEEGRILKQTQNEIVTLKEKISCSAQCQPQSCTPASSLDDVSTLQYQKTADGLIFIDSSEGACLDSEAGLEIYFKLK